MKKLFTLLLIANLASINSSKAQNIPVAVNDTFYVDYNPVGIYYFVRNTIIANDHDIDNNVLVIDTFSYNGINLVQSSYFAGSTTFLRLKELRLITPSGYFGKDSITYYLTDNGFPTGYDTATIYIYVKRKAYENIDLNNIKARVDKEGMFQDRENGIAAFEAPKGSGSNTIFAANFWLAGLDAVGQLKGYAETFAVNGVNNAGPIMDSVNYEDYSYKWDRVWKVSASDIQNHINGLGTTEAITNWPAHGDTSLGQSANLAPFVDVDNNGIYNPLLGDYPKIKGQQTIFFIRNSDRSFNEMLTTNNNLEFHGMVYAYDCPEDSAINNTLFLDYTIYNRSAFTLADCYFGQWTDFDLGNSADDFVGCDVSRGTFYGYNGDINDEDANGVTGYGFSPPAQGVTFLKGAEQANDATDNPFTTDIPTAIAQNGIPYAGLGTGFGDGILDNEYLGLSHFMAYKYGTGIDGSPAIASDIYNYLLGKWRDGSQVNCSGEFINYMFPGNSDSLNWSTGGIVPPSNCSGTVPGSIGNYEGIGVGSTGPFTLLPGASQEMELAFVFGRDYAGTDNLASIVVMQERVDSIRSYHANGFATTPCGGAIIGVKEVAKDNNTLSIYPNPFANQFLVNYKPSNKTTVEVYNLLGAKVSSQQITQYLTLLDLSNEPNGVYFVRVTDGKEVITRKVIKQ